MKFTVHESAGSAVRFDPPDPSLRPITIHKPHPGSTMRPDVVYGIRRRLRNYYGWVGTTFYTEARGKRADEDDGSDADIEDID